MVLKKKMLLQHGRTITLMSTELLAIRHGESYTNVNNEFSCRIVDHGLTQRGIEESTYTALWLSRCGVSAIYSSPLRRAKETAAIIGKTIGLDVIVKEALREVDVGSLESQPSSKNWQLHNAIIDAWKQGQWDVSFPQGESFASLVQRVRLLIQNMAVRNPMRRLAVITHGAVLLSIRYGLCAEDIKTDTPTGSAIRVVVDVNHRSPKFRIASSPIIDHLAGNTAHNYHTGG
jgi:probable phosphoglycerate mutase